MTISTMKNKLIRLAYKILIPIAFWITIWELLAIIVNNSYFLPHISETATALCAVITSDKFFKSIIFTFLRVLFGLVLGIIGGCLLAVISHHVHILKSIISPIISVIKATPVATFIILLWVSLSGNALTVAIAFLMVLPIIWQNVLDGYDAVSAELSEVCLIYNVKGIRKFNLLVFPTLLKYLTPAVITSAGLAWKSEIAAEIIAYTKNSIGQFMNDAKYNFDTATVFAWTLIIIALSILLERLTRYLLRRISK